MRQYQSAIIAALTGFVISVGGYQYTRDLELRNAHNAFINRAQEQSASIAASVDSRLLILQAIHDLFVATNGIERFEFHSFVDPFIQELDGVRALEWVPRVSAEERADFEARIQATGNAEFYIKERNSSGELVRAADRDEYFPVVDLESQQNREAVTGFDLASEATRLLAIEKARISGDITVTAPIQLVQGDGGSWGTQIFMPLYAPGAPTDTPRADQLTGFIMGLFFVPDLVDASLSVLSTGGLYIEIYDVTDADDVHHLYSFPSERVHPSEPKFEQDASGYPFFSSLNLGDRTWTVVCDVTPEFLAANTSSMPSAILLGGFLMTGLLVLYLANGQRQTLALGKANMALGDSQAELATANDMLQAVLDTIPVRVYWKDTESRYLGCNRTFSQDAGRSTPEEIVGLTDADLMWKHQAGEFREHDQSIMKSQEPDYNYIESHKNMDGDPVLLRMNKVPLTDFQGNVIGVLGTYEDITEQTRHESEFEKLNKALEESSNEIYIFDVDTLNFSYCNRGAMRNLGYDLTEILELTPVDIKPEYTFEAFDYLANSLRSGEESELHFETIHERKDGTTYPVEVRLSLSRSGESAFFLAVILDISERRAQEVERQKLEQQIQHAQKLESLGVLAGGIAHDFNNLLLGILGNADLALLNLSPSAVGREHVEEIVTISQRAADLCKQMLAYSGKGRFVVQAVNLSDVVEDMAHLLEISISKRAVIKYDFATDLPAVEADVTQVRQVVMNLITNASDAVGERSGIITISTGAQECDNNYFESTYCDDDLPEGMYIYMEVSDTGCGMDKQTKARIFDPFFTSKETGRGLGMAAVLGIVRGHHGAVKVYSEPGRGTSTKVLFPASEQPVAPIEHTPELDPSHHGEGTVLVVDDDSTIRALTKRILTMGGYEVLSASDGREGVDMFREHHQDIVGVLLDMTMPRLNGEEAFGEMRQIRPDVKVILTSGYNEQDATNRFAGKGLAGFIQKPYQAKELLAIIHSMLSS